MTKSRNDRALHHLQTLREIIGTMLTTTTQQFQHVTGAIWALNLTSNTTLPPTEGRDSLSLAGSIWIGHNTIHLNYQSFITMQDMSSRHSSSLKGSTLMNKYARHTLQTSMLSTTTKTKKILNSQFLEKNMELKGAIRTSNGA